MGFGDWLARKLARGAERTVDRAVDKSIDKAADKVADKIVDKAFENSSANPNSSAYTREEKVNMMANNYANNVQAMQFAALQSMPGITPSIKDTPEYVRYTYDYYNLDPSTYVEMEKSFIKEGYTKATDVRYDSKDMKSYIIFEPDGSHLHLVYHIKK